MGAKEYVLERMEGAKELLAQYQLDIVDMFAKAEEYDSMRQLWLNNQERATRAEKALREIKAYCEGDSYYRQGFSAFGSVDSMIIYNRMKTIQAMVVKGLKQPGQDSQASACEPEASQEVESIEKDPETELGASRGFKRYVGLKREEG